MGVTRKPRSEETATAPAPSAVPHAVLDLNKWHRALHQVTGDMALNFNRASTADLARWAEALREIVAEMAAAIEVTYPALSQLDDSL
jgi:hypothetical protein